MTLKNARGIAHTGQLPMDHSPEDCPMVDIVNFRFGIFSSEPPKDL